MIGIWMWVWTKAQEFFFDIFSTRVFKKLSLIVSIISTRYYTFDEAVAIIADETKAVIHYSLLLTSDERYAYCAHQLIDLAKTSGLAVYRDNYPGKDKVIVPIYILSNTTSDYKSTYINKHELWEALKTQKTKQKELKKLFKKMDEELTKHGVKTDKYKSLEYKHTTMVISSRLFFE